MDVQTPIRGREYLRVSQDRSGRLQSPDEQHHENQEAAEERGVILGEEYREANGVSASRYSTKARDAFEALIKDLENDEFGADELWIWEVSRGSRKVSEWVQLIELCEQRGVKIYVTSEENLYDPSKPRDRKALIDAASDAEYESSKTQKRVARSMASEAMRGRPHAVPPFGYRRVFDQRTGRLITWEEHPDEAPIVRELFDRLYQGHAFAAIAKDFEQRGIVHRSDRPFTTGHLRDFVTQVALIGKRRWRDEVIDGVWNGIIAEDVFYAVNRQISDPSRRTAKNGKAVHAFSMILRCDVCGGPMSVTRRSHGRGQPGIESYKCHQADHVKIVKDGVDEVVEAAILAYLATDKIYKDFARRAAEPAKVKALGATIARLRAEQAEMEAETPETLSEAKVLARAIEAKRTKLATKEAEEREVTVPPAVNMIKPGKDVAARWHAAPVSARREVAKMLLSPEVLGQVRIKRAEVIRRANGTRAKQPADERIVWLRES